MIRRLEKHEQAETVRLLDLIGAATWVLGTRRPRPRPCPMCGLIVGESQGTRQTPGISDLITFLPGTPAPVLFIEQKRPGGRLSPAQQDFRAIVEASTAGYVHGTAAEVAAWLQRAGFVR